MKKTLEWTHPALHLVQKALMAAVAIIVAVGLFVSPVTAFAENASTTDLTAPTHEKTVTDNGDGTYKITLSVTGNSVQSSTTTHADVIVVMDLSRSMNYGQWGDYYTRPSRLSVAKSAVNSLADELLSNNTIDNPDAVRLSLVTFSDYATVNKEFTTDLDDFQDTADGLSATGGTNWEDALTVANSMQTRDASHTYIIFVSDGNPTFRNTLGGYTDYREDRESTSGSHTYYGSGNSDDNGKNYYYASQVASSITDADKILFSVGVFGNVSRMQQLASDAGQAGNYYSASDQTSLNQAFQNIANTITTNISYTNVKIEDTLNSTYVDYALPTNASVPEFTYSYKKNGVDYTPTSPIPSASFTDGKVSWDLGSIELEKGVTYAVSFNVKLNQKAYDDAANAEDIFKVYTNSTGTLSYRKITRVTGQEPKYSDQETLEYDNPQVTVPVSKLTVSKSWKNSDGTDADSSLLPDALVVTVKQTNAKGETNYTYRTVTLNAANNWTSTVNVSAGPGGNTYSVTENTTDAWAQGLPNAVKLTGLTAQTGTQAITNTYRTGTLTLKKMTKGNAANTSDSFKFELNCAGLENKTFTSEDKTIAFDGTGKAEVELSNDETITLNNVPADTTIVITETSTTPNAKTTTTAKVGDTTTTFTRDEPKTVNATVTDGGTTDVVYTNQAEIVPDTGLDIFTASQGVLLGVAVAGAATLAAAAIRKNHGE